MDVDDVLANAISEKMKIVIIYHGGSQPGTGRQITPLNIKDGKVMAYCHTSDAMKQFAIEKISIIDKRVQSDMVSWQSKIQPSQRYESIEDFLEEHQNNLTQMGWHIGGSEKNLSLHRIGKRGKPLKNYDICLAFDEHTHDTLMDENGNFYKANFRKRQRPWTIRAESEKPRNYGSLGAASELFMELAQKYAPSSGGAVT